MRNLRREDLSLHQYIKLSVLQPFIETEYNVPLEYVVDESSVNSQIYQAASNRIPTPWSRGRGWTYVDEFESKSCVMNTVEQQNSIFVYDSLANLIPRIDPVTSGINYLIDYVDCRVVFPNKNVIPAAITYRWNYVSVVDEWEDALSPGSPVVVINIAGFQKEGFQLGGGKKVPRRAHIHIFATDTSERDDLLEVLYDGIYLKSCPYYTYEKGSMLEYNGTFNNDFVGTTVSGFSYLHFDDPVSAAFTPPLMLVPLRDHKLDSDLNRYRARISFDLVHWEEK